MRWILAGMAFALLIGLAVFTVAIKARNLATRARIARLEEQIMWLRVEQARRVLQYADGTSSEELIQRLRQLMRRARRSSQ